MAKYIIFYRPSDGEILQITGKAEDQDIVAQGTGKIVEDHMVGIDLGGEPSSSVEYVILDGYKRMLIKSWIDDTHLIFSNSALRFQGAQSYEMMKTGTLVQYTAQEKSDMIAALKTETGSDDVDAVLITTDQMLSTLEHFVDTSDGNKIKVRSLTPITPE